MLVSEGIDQVLFRKCSRNTHTHGPTELDANAAPGFHRARTSPRTERIRIQQSQEAALNHSSTNFKRHTVKIAFK